MGSPVTAIEYGSKKFLIPVKRDNDTSRDKTPAIIAGALAGQICQDRNTVAAHPP
jgi:hypothetical protein